MFLTAMAANPLAAELAAGLGVEITWSAWALAALVPGLTSLIVVPLVIYRLYPPEIERTPEAVRMARGELAKMGPMTRGEWVMLVALGVLLVLWVFGAHIGMHSTTAALVGLALLLLTGVLSWDDVCGERDAWSTLVWFASLVMMASFLNELGLVPWFSERVGAAMRGVHWLPAFLALCLTYFYSHYFFASNTAHVSSMYAPFLGVAIVVGAPPLLAALTLGYFSNLFSGTTHYGTGPAPILFGSRYVGLGAWWALGGLISVINIAIWLGVGGAWWKLLGYW
jgi:DASS family divalent anion:Na+ symporter